MGTPITHPDSCFLIISAHVLPAFCQGKICISTFLSVFQMQASLTSILFQLVYKNKYPAKTVSKTVQDARTNSFLSTFPGQQQTQDDLLVPFAKMHYNPAQINACQTRLSSPYKWNLNNTFPIWKLFIYNVGDPMLLINFKFNKIKLPKNFYI